MRNLRSHLTYANVVSTLALFAVLAGGGAYAASKIGGKDLKRVVQREGREVSLSAEFPKLAEARCRGNELLLRGGYAVRDTDQSELRFGPANAIVLADSFSDQKRIYRVGAMLRDAAPPAATAAIQPVAYCLKP